MSSSNLPVDVLVMILKNLDKADLITMCRVNKVCCSFSQDILYRNIHIYHRPLFKVCRTLAHSTHLARRVRSFFVSPLDSTMESNQVDNLATALRNMSSLRKLDLRLVTEFSNILDGCTFKLDSFLFSFCCDEYLLNFLNSQPSLTHVGMLGASFDELRAMYHRRFVFDATCLPNLTRVSAPVAWLSYLIPGRPVSEVEVSGYSSLDNDFIDWSFFTLSTTPIRKLSMTQSFLFDKPAEFLAPLFPSLVHLRIKTPHYGDVRRLFF